MMKMTARAELDERGRIHLQAPREDRHAIRTIPGARWDAKRATWHLPCSWAACVQMREVFGLSLDVGPELREWANAEYEQRVRPLAILREQDDAPGQEGLWSFQRVGVGFLNYSGGAILGDDMGLGKTRTMLTSLREQDAFPALVVCPNSVKRSWAAEIQRVAPLLRVVVVDGPREHREAAIASVYTHDVDIVIIHWEALRLETRIASFGPHELARCPACGGPEAGEEGAVTRQGCDVHLGALNAIEWAAVVADEAHRAKSAASKQTRALWYVAHQQPCVRYALTGTPITNTPDDLWSILHFIDPVEWPTKTQFIDRYCLQEFTPFRERGDVIGLLPWMKPEFYRLFDLRFLRRIKRDVMPELPEKRYQERFVSMSVEQRHAYEQMARYFVALVEDGDPVVASNPLVQLTRLTQFSSAYAALDDAGNVTMAEPSSKLDELEVVLDELGDEPVVVFAESRQLIQLAEQRLKHRIPTVSIRGGIPPQQRQDNVEAFARGDARVCFVTLGAGGEGLDGLQHGAKTAIFLQRSWRLIANRQGEDRVHRGGQEGSVLIIDIKTEGTVEERQEELLEAKGDRLEEVVRDLASLLSPEVTA